MKQIRQARGRLPAASTPPQLGSTASIAIDTPANEIFLADGYVNHRMSCSTPTPSPSNACGAPMASRRRTMKLANYNPESAQFANPGALREDRQ